METAEAGKRPAKVHVDGNYEAAKGQTKLVDDPGHVTSTVSGLVPLRFATSGGTVSIDR